MFFSPLTAQPFNCCLWIGGVRQKTVFILRNLQKHFRGEWFASLQNITLVTFALCCARHAQDRECKVLERKRDRRKRAGERQQEVRQECL